MRLRLLLRRLTISAPRMAVRSALPWPLRWVAVALVLGFCAAIGLWAFERGKEIAGLDGHSAQEWRALQSELQALQADNLRLRAERDRAQQVANTADTVLTSERATHEKLALQTRQLETENQRLRDDLGFFEKLIPSSAGEGVAIRGVQAELRNGNEIKWQVLVLQARKNAPEFTGQLELIFSGTLAGKAWSTPASGAPLPLKLRQYGRLEGVFAIPAQAQVKTLSARVLDGSVVKAQQTIKLP